MRRFAGVLAFGAMISFASSVSALTADGNWSDWFSYGGNVNFANWNEGLVTLNNVAYRTQNDEEGPTPGGGGQRYDIEQIFYFYQDAGAGLTGGKLFVGLVTGFPPAGVDADHLYAGDMFFDFGADGSRDVAVATSTSTVNIDRETGNVAGSVDNAYFNNNYLITNPASQLRDPNPFTASTPWRVYRDTNSFPGGTLNALTSTTAWGQQGVHYFLEVCLEVDGSIEEIISNEQTGGLGLHWTMQCGNDVIDVVDDTPLVPVPEPSTFALLGLGVLGVGLRRKFAA